LRQEKMQVRDVGEMICDSSERYLAFKGQTRKAIRELSHKYPGAAHALTLGCITQHNWRLVIRGLWTREFCQKKGVSSNQF
jgi:hypothetical protein